MQNINIGSFEMKCKHLSRLIVFYPELCLMDHPLGGAIAQYISVLVAEALLQSLTYNLKSIEKNRYK